MKIVEVNYTDLDGQVFNGYDLMNCLNNQGYDIWQVVRKKKSHNARVIEVGYDWIVHEQIRELERKYRVENILFPYSKLIKGLEVVKKADILHMHILHNDFISLFDYSDLFEGKKVVWTIHDPWVLTGGCIHPFECKGWLNKCDICDELPSKIYHTDAVNVVDMRIVKENMWKLISPEIIVSSNFMQKLIQESPMTQQCLNVHKIPFGVKIRKNGSMELLELKKKRILSGKRLTLGFRVSNDINKGCVLLYEALRMFSLESKIKLLAVGTGRIPFDLKEKYEIEELGWCQETEMEHFWNRVDFFVMPSLAETFGLMAIESMAAYVPVICFENTSVAEVTKAPKIGMSAKWGSSADLGRIISECISNNKEMIIRALAGRALVEEKYTFEEYIQKHKQLFERLMVE